tara:strand:- start:2866 stop:3636 length:771 start_codon:yes stop_codon:yes gene_type:complete
LVQLNINESVAVIEVNRPKHLNALSSELLNQLEEKIDLTIKDEKIRVIILTGSGEKAFIAGADILEMKDMSPQKALEYSRKGQYLTQKIENSIKPVIAAINGFALGGGCEFAMACHFRYASENARFGQPEVGIGLIPGFGGTQRLRSLVGKGHASELLLSGKIIDAQEALRIGLVNKVFKIDKLKKECMEIAKKINYNSPLAVSYTIKAQNLGENKPIEEGLEIEASYFKKIFKTVDSKEGLSAFKEKRKPRFIGK